MCLVIGGCGGAESLKSPSMSGGDATDATTGTTGTTDEPTLPGVTESEVGSVPELISPESRVRQKKRMTVRQVRDSMERITGGIVWGSGDESDWDTYAATLGVADYQARTSSDRTPSVLFQKFLDDAAAHTCARWVAAPGSSFFEVDDPTSTERADVVANIEGLRWQIQGRPRTDDAPVIEDYVDLYATMVRRTASTSAAWNTVCVAMFTHPDFFMY